MTEPTGQTTALAIPEKGPAIARIVQSIKGVVADLLPKYIVEGGKKRRLTLADRMKMVEDHLVMSSTSAGSPHITQVIFGGERKRVGSTLAQMVKDGVPQFEDDGRPTMGFVPEYDIAIVGKCELPDRKNPNKRIEVEVQPALLCNRRGGLIPYVTIDETTGQIRAGQAMHCIFIRDFDPKTGKENRRIRAVPLGLSDSAEITRYNDIVDRLTAQGSSKAWEKIQEIGNNFGRAACFLTLKPAGSPATMGLTPVWKEWNFSELDPTRCDFWIVARLGGKVATLGKKSQPIIIKDGIVPEQILRVEEYWNSVELITWGLPGEIGDTELRELEQAEMNVDWLTLFGTSLYSVNPRSGSTLLRDALRMPPMDGMVGIGLLPPGGTREMAIATLRGLGAKIRGSIANTVEQALKDLTHNLGPSGRENPSLSLADVLGGEPTGELLEQALNNPNEDNLLVTAILASTTATNLGLEVWDSKCWVLIETYKTLLLDMASYSGVELPLPPEADAPPDVPPLDTPARTEDPASSP